MLVVQVLPDEGVGLDRAVGIHLRHVHVIDEVDELLCARRPVVAACKRYYEGCYCDRFYTPYRMMSSSLVYLYHVYN